MELNRIIVVVKCIFLVNAKVININENSDVRNATDKEIKNPDKSFDAVYTDCLVHMSYPCVQRKTLMYLKQLNNLSEVSVIGDYVMFVKLNISQTDENKDSDEYFSEKNSEELTHMIDRAIDNFFDNHIIKFSALGRETSLSIPNNVEEFVGRKKHKGGGGGGGDGGGHDGGDFSKKKMMMMAMMCMKMKLMMMIPAMMGMMGMMSFKGMMFSMMSFMISKMMLLMKILEKKGGAGGGGGGGSGTDGGWATGGGGGGAWMPAGGADYGGVGGGGGGYDANGQWQSRSILDFEDEEEIIKNKPIISYVAPIVRYNNVKIDKAKRVSTNTGKESIRVNKNKSTKSRRKRSIIDLLQNSYLYWINKILGINNNNRRTSNYPKYKIVNGVKYVFYPFRQQKVKAPKEIHSNRIKNVDEGFKPIITAEDFNKGEIVEGAVESRMNRKKFNKMKETVNDTLEDNPWE